MGEFDEIVEAPYARRMERAYVDWVRIENFRCIKSVHLHLTPVHAFIGPNDSGKSTILKAIHSLRCSAWISDIGAVFHAQNWLRGAYPLVAGPPLRRTEVAKADHVVGRRNLLRLDPDELRQSRSLIPQTEKLWFQSERGLGLPSVYDALLNRDRDAFIRIDQRFRALFPTVKALRLENSSTNTKSMGLTLHDDTEVGPSEMSEGMLYWLAFAVIEHIAPGGILMVEEPENGLHPARIKEVMRVLREVSTRTQVLIATHSPLVVNELDASEVTLVTRSKEKGTEAILMSDTKNFQERSKTYDLGELWLAYADGDHEKELTATNDPATKAG
jgi:predicted ATPase